MQLNIGDKIYYTGDMANVSGWFLVSKMRGHLSVDMNECEGDLSQNRTLRGIMLIQIADKYSGHCGDRFVTELAYKTHRAAAIAEMEAAAAKYRARHEA